MGIHKDDALIKFGLGGWRNAQLVKQAFDKLRSIRLICRKDPWHLSECLQQGRQQIEGDGYDLPAFRKQFSSLHAVAETGDKIIEFPAQKWVTVSPGTADRR